MGNARLIARKATTACRAAGVREAGAGSASTADLSPAALKRTVEAAVDIAKYTSEDPCAGVADASWLEFSPPDLDLFHPASVSTEQAIALCAEMEQAAFELFEDINADDL